MGVRSITLLGGKKKFIEREEEENPDHRKVIGVFLCPEEFWDDPLRRIRKI
jgi:hypothetical protein